MKSATSTHMQRHDEMNQVQDSHLLLDSRNQSFSLVWWLVCPPTYTHFQLSALMLLKWQHMKMTNSCNTGIVSIVKTWEIHKSARLRWKMKVDPVFVDMGFLFRGNSVGRMHVVLKFQRFKHGCTHLQRRKLPAKAGSICGRHVQNTVGTVIEMPRRFGHILTNTSKDAFRPSQAETRSRNISTRSRSRREIRDQGVKRAKKYF